MPLRPGRLILVTGATGYIGGRLIPRLLEAGHRVRVLVRDADRVRGREWSDKVEVFAGDPLEDPAPLQAAAAGCDAAYYLIHSMGAGPGFEGRDLEAAGRFADAAREVAHVIYLGGLLPSGEAGSDHLRSRAATGALLRERLRVTEFRAGPIIGSGSASFEMVRYLTERLPAMVAPRWILNPVQPIAIRDVLSYLVAALAAGPQGIVEIGAERLSFREMMHGYAAVRGLRRWILPVPVLAPGVAARWVGWVTPIPNLLAIPLIEGIVTPVVADTQRAGELFPAIHPIGYREAVGRALDRTRSGEVETRWSGALGARSAAVTCELRDREGLIREIRTVKTAASPEAVFASFCALGGEAGWPAWGWAWRIRGALDRMLGGPGLRRGRRHARALWPGEALDFWRVEAVEPPRLLRLRAEMKVPGRAWLQYEAVPEDGGTRLVQTALFEPEGLAGTLYWYVLYPIHARIFSDLAKALARRAEASPNFEL